MANKENTDPARETPDLERIAKKLSDDAEALQEERSQRGKPATSPMEGPEARDPESLLSQKDDRVARGATDAEDESEDVRKLVEEGVDEASDEQSEEARRNRGLMGE